MLIVSTMTKMPMMMLMGFILVQGRCICIHMQCIISSQTSIVLVIGFSTFLSVVLVIVLSTSLPAYISTLSLHISLHPSFLFPRLSVHLLSVHLSHLDSFPSLSLSLFPSLSLSLENRNIKKSKKSKKSIEKKKSIVKVYGKIGKTTNYILTLHSRFPESKIKMKRRKKERKGKTILARTTSFVLSFQFSSFLRSIL